MKYIFSLLTFVFALCITSVYAQVYDASQSVDSLDQQIHETSRMKKIKFYEGDIEFLERLRQKEEGQGQVRIIQDYRIDDLLKIDRSENSEAPGFYGWRIQVFSGGGRDREKAVFIKNELEERFPNDRVYLKYHAPDFRVLIGNFRTNFEAVYLYKKCLKLYPNSYIRRDQIDLADLEAQEKNVIEEIK
ncbi:hypothetical protein DWB61_09620 [Ancylomarina euxinus]|uniref:SPOR domain-containing protein n=1 Tax=Ancylomarina euxinus TaxID=2283627 RepID=A0A425Y115_9BACT|nr:hypothetical protein [Ancylomarina euxinus]MCZ4693814.1 hypothetical protein [Ancylomarina euxinus]MUP15107.1 hypothetical protein [Ancylomarina euxinus]RRG21529.1 hypothetical protein DWB61_09620 [Ancylomarina euxinus]